MDDVKRWILVAALTVMAVGCSAGHSPTSATEKPAPGRVSTQPSARDEVLVLDDGLSAIVTVDPNADVIGVRPITLTESFHLAFLGDQTLVLAADDTTVHAVPLGGGTMHNLPSDFPIPGWQAGTVWITGVLPKVRLVDDVGRVLLEKPGPPDPRRPSACLDCPAVAVAAVPGALVFQSATGFDVWNTESGRMTRHLGNKWSYDAPAFGSMLPWCTDCNRALELTDLASGATKEVALSMDGGSDALRLARWSPDGTRLAIPEEVDPGRTASVIIVDVAAGRATRLATIGQTASVAWSSDSQRLYIAASNVHETRVTVRDVEAGNSKSIRTIPLPALHLGAIVSSAQAAYLLGGPRVASSGSCVVPIPIRQPPRACSYRY